MLLCFLLSSAFLVRAQVNTVDTIAKYIVGEWDWRIRTGGIAGVWQTPEITGHKEKLVFLNNDTVESYYDGNLVAKSPYKIEIGKGITSLDSMDLLYLNNMPNSVVIKGDSLFLTEEVYDGFSETYVRNNIGVGNSNCRQSTGLNIFPNPCQNEIHIQSEGKRALRTIGIYAPSGVQVLNATTTDEWLNLSTLRKGLYFIRISDGEKTTSTILLKQ